MYSIKNSLSPCIRHAPPDGPRSYPDRWSGVRPPRKQGNKKCSSCTEKLETDRQKTNNISSCLGGQWMWQALYLLRHRRVRSDTHIGELESVNNNSSAFNHVYANNVSSKQSLLQNRPVAAALRATTNPKRSTVNPKPQTLHPKPQTRIPLLRGLEHILQRVILHYPLTPEP